MSHEKKKAYFPLKPGCLIGILISWFTIIPTYQGSIIPYLNNEVFFHCSNDDYLLMLKILGIKNPFRTPSRKVFNLGPER